MSNITVEIPINIDAIIRQLTTQDKIELVKKLEKETRRQRWKSFLSRIDKRAIKNPISEKEIEQAVKETRRKLYAKSGY